MRPRNVKRDGWASRLTGKCLTPYCRAKAVQSQRGRWCEPCGERLAAWRVELGYEAKRKLRTPKTSPVVIRQLEPTPEGVEARPGQCRLIGCQKPSQGGKSNAACYRHRGVDPSVTEAPSKALCSVEGCRRVAFQEKAECREHFIPSHTKRPAIRCRVANCPHDREEGAVYCEKHAHRAEPKAA